jgi:hypothetical protein
MVATHEAHSTASDSDGGSSDSSSSSKDGSIQHFNWQTKGSRQECAATLVQALIDDPVNQFFTGSSGGLHMGAG